MRRRKGTRMDFQPQPPDNIAGRGPSARNYAIATELREHPGEWAIVCHVPERASINGFAYKIRQGASAAFGPVGTFDAKTRTNPDGGFDLWASYIG